MKICDYLIFVFDFLILSNFLINCQKYHIVHRGPCLNKTKDFCHLQVPNSFCSPKTNECFCINGFVSIKEFSRIICKSLLTDIVCRGDHHCTHVKDSICHPGAMRCTCPAETIYVPELHSCMTKYVGQSSTVCDKCRRLGGECYTNKSESESTAVNCRCPNNRVNVHWITVFNQPRSICSGLAVDIGQYCDGKRIICKSKFAVCKTTINIPLKTCQCPSSRVVVFQKQLKYFECYMKADFDESNACKICRMKEGQCFLREGYGNKYGCKCSNLLPNIFSNVNSKYLNISTKSCLSEFITVSCWFNSLEICFKIKTGDLEKHLRQGHSLSFIGKSDLQNPNISANCRLKFTSIKDDLISFCTNIRLDFNKALPCDITSIKYSDGSLFQGQFHLWYNKYFRDISRDLQLDFSCKSQRTQYKAMIGNIIDKSLKLDPITNPSTSRLVKLQAQNIQGDEISTIRKDDLIQLSIELDQYQNKFQSINVEKCSLEAETSLSESNSSKTNLMISTPRECLDSKHISLIPTLSWNKESFSIPKKLKSELFTLQMFHIKENSKLRIICSYSICNGMFSLCIDANICGKENQLNSETNNGLMISNNYNHNNNNNNNNNYSSANVHLIINAIELDYISESVNHLSPPKMKKKRFCDESICLTDTHMWIISFFCLICIISLIIFIVCLWRKVQHNPTLYYNNNKPDVLLQNPILISNKNIGLSNIINPSYQELGRNMKTLSPKIDDNSKPTYISNSLNNVLFFNSLTEKDPSISIDNDKIELMTPVRKSTQSLTPNSDCKLYLNYHILSSNPSSSGNLICRCQEDSGL